MSSKNIIDFVMKRGKPITSHFLRGDVRHDAREGWYVASRKLHHSCYALRFV